jgi:hypothetical protein
MGKLEKALAHRIKELGELECWSGYTEDEYKRVKEQGTEEILAEIGKVIPVKENLLFAEAVTPLTY